ncbi:MAG: ornithine--oxo-acid transaminase [Gammaproteobacteria bacterium]|nr:ornithine--oxo-acid transaminase [Gammaproteobacteria bacterium]
MPILKTEDIIEREGRFCAHNYHPLPVVLTRGRGIHVWDDQNRRYIDMMSAYSAISLGHQHPRIISALSSQMSKLTVVSRAFYTDKLGPFLEKACQLTAQDRALPMNTGAEAVETALKAARKWAYKVKGVEKDKAEIIACEGNFHGRTIAIVGMSSEEQYKDGFGPFPPGFKLVPYGDAAALEAAITPNTAAFIVEPVQGEAGIIVPPPGYLAECARICKKHNVLLIADEIQTGLGRTGKFLACEHDNVKPDGLILGKALGGGILPVSMFLARENVMNVFTPGDHGSTFGGNPLAAVVGYEALCVVTEKRLAEHAEAMGEHFLTELRKIDHPWIKEIRGKGLLIGMEIDPNRGNARTLCEALMAKGLLSKETHSTVIRFAPPLIITRNELDQAIGCVRDAMKELK